MLYDTFVVCFVQMVLAMMLVLSPLRRAGLRLSGSRVTQVLLTLLGAMSISAIACLVAGGLWGFTADPLETAAYFLTLVSVVVIVVRPYWTFVGQIFVASYIAGALTYLAFAIDVTATVTHGALESLTSVALVLIELAALYIWVAYVVETTDVLCRRGPSRDRPRPDPGFLPMVSVHIPAYNEPPELLIATIAAVERLDYPDFEIVVIDNNTTDPGIYGPVEEYCRGRERVRFVHVAPWPGFKAGALNLALQRYTDDRAELIALVDSDDIVVPHYLRETAPYFSDGQLGFLQSFEGNRDFEGSPYYTACVDGFQTFYLGNMSTRNERGSIPFVGTMGLVRRRALEAIGGWDEHCICEDTEASLRMMKQGWSGLYVPRCFGRGIVAPTFEGLRRQRYRWCFGAMQIFRSHWRSLMPWNRDPDNALTKAQRFDYLGACFRWCNDLLCLIFSALLLTVTGLLLSHSSFSLLPLGNERAVLPLVLLGFAVVSMTWALREQTTVTFRRALYALAVYLSQSLTVAVACVEGLFRERGVFRRTPKFVGRHRVRSALWQTRWETLLAAALYGSAAALTTLSRPPIFLIVVIAATGSVYACSPVVSLVNQRARLVEAPERERRSERVRVRRASARPAFQFAASVAVAAVTVGGGVVAAAYVGPSAFLHAPVHTVGPLSLSSSARTQLTVRLGRAAVSYPVTSAVLTEQHGGFTLQLVTSSGPLLETLVQHDGTGDPITPLTLSMHRTGSSGKPAAVTADVFADAVVTALDETFADAPVGTVTLSLSGLEQSGSSGA
jgi:cellulose synthase/poly-beta-1,6-N-acetylglucosamine synthase-like glycosyltransferase